MAGDALLPVLVKDAAFTPPDVPSYYVLAQDGLFLVRRTRLYSASVAVAGGVPGLLAQGASLTLDLPRLPRALLERAVGFFRAVYDQWRGEAILFIFYLPAEDARAARFVLAAPPQLIRGRYAYGRFVADLRLEYGTCERPGPGYVKLGTFHSHADASPTHSGVDMHDELFETGLHITAGYVDTRVPEFAAAFVVGQTRFKIPAEQVLPRFHAARRAPASWLAQITVAYRAWSPYDYGWRRGGDTDNGCGGSGFAG